MKRIFLFLFTNILVVLTLGIVANVLGLNRYLQGTGLNVSMLLVFSLFMGFSGSIISLLISKKMAIWSTGAVIIESANNETESWLLEKVATLAQLSNIKMPTVAIYDSPEPNAFATGATRDNSLVAVSTGLLENMNHSEVLGVLAHEISHIANGDMITMTLMQGVVNTFTIFFARIVGFVVDRVILKNENGRGLAYFATVLIAELVFSLLGSILVLWFSRHREYKADEGSAQLAGKNPMIAALGRLEQLSNNSPSALPKSMVAFGISGGSSWVSLFSTHPSLKDRIAHLEKL